MSDRTRKEALFDAFAAIGRALASGRRAEIVDLLLNGERSVESIAEEIGQSIANTSHHLQILKRVGLLASRRKGTSVLYRASSAEVATFWRSMQAVARQTRPEVERLIDEYLGPSDTEAVTKEQLWSKIQRGARVVVLDVRPEKEFRSGHLPRARSIPLNELENRLSELPRSIEIVAYCRGPLCAMAPEAARLLHSKGYKVKRLEDGVAEWRAAGLPVDAA